MGRRLQLNTNIHELIKINECWCVARVLLCYYYGGCSCSQYTDVHKCEFNFKLLLVA